MELGLVIVALGPTLILLALLLSIREQLVIIRRLLIAASDMNLEGQERIVKALKAGSEDVLNPSAAR
jgi:hypothetical protein